MVRYQTACLPSTNTKLVRQLKHVHTTIPLFTFTWVTPVTCIAPLGLWKYLSLSFIPVTPRTFRKMFLCKTQSQPGCSLELVCQELTVRIRWIQSVSHFTFFFIISFCFSSLSFVSLLSLRYLCWRTIRGNCPEGILHWSQATLLSCPRRADRSQGNPSQLQPWSCHCK